RRSPKISAYCLANCAERQERKKGGSEKGEKERRELKQYPPPAPLSVFNCRRWSSGSGLSRPARSEVLPSRDARRANRRQRVATRLHRRVAEAARNLLAGLRLKEREEQLESVVAVIIRA